MIEGIVIGGIMGLLVGSFLSVVVVRYDTAESVARGRSRCRACRAQIAWYDNVPLLSYALLRGRCRECRARIAPLYPAIEAVTAVVFGAITWALLRTAVPPVLSWDTVVTLLLAWAVAAGLIVIFFYDLRTMHIPMQVVWACLFFVGALLVWRLLLSAPAPMLAGMLAHGIGGIVGWGFLFALSALSRERWMGAGDASIGLIGGLLTGWPAVVFFLTVSFGVGALVGIALIATGMRTRKDAVPFAPFLITGIALTLLFPLLFPHAAVALPYF